MSSFEDMFINALRNASENADKPYTSKHDALEDLKEFVKNKDGKEIKEGDVVERNDNGKKRYKFPQEGQVAMCHKKFDEPVYEENDVKDMSIVVAMAQGVFREYTVDSRYYRKAEKPGKNIISGVFGRKK